MKVAKHSLAFVLSAAWIGILGCETGNGRGPSREQLEGRVPKGTGFEVPPPPPPKDVPLDKGLQAAARQELEGAVKAPEPDVRVHAVDGMRQALGRAAAPHILQALNDGDAVVRFGAAMAAGELKLAEARKRLLELVNDRSPSVQVAVRFALHKLGDNSRSHDLEVLGLDPKPSVRANTAVALGRLGEPSAVKILHRMRLDRDAKVRQTASEALWLLGNTQGEDDLLGLLSSQHPDDQMFGLLALSATHDARMTEYLRVGLKSPYPEVQLVAARAVGRVSPRTGESAPYDLGYNIAVGGARSKDPRNRIMGALALGAIGRNDSQDVLRDLLKDQNADVRVAAATAILELGKAPQNRGA